MKQFFIIALVTTILGVSPVFAAGQTTLVSVNGMVCDFCARALEKVFSKQEGVGGISVNLDTKIITITFKEGAQPLSDEVIKKLVNDSGYSIEGIEHGGA